MFKRFVLFALIACLTLGLCACGEKEPAQTTGAPTESQENTDDGLVDYTVYVEDTEGNPIAGARVQLCKETCMPGVTNELGTAVFHTKVDTYKVSFMDGGIPEGYTADAGEFYFSEGSYELTIILKAAA